MLSRNATVRVRSSASTGTPAKRRRQHLAAQRDKEDDRCGSRAAGDQMAARDPDSLAPCFPHGLSFSLGPSKS